MCFTVHRHLASAWPFAPQTQAFFTIDCVNRVLANLPAFALQHDVYASISIPSPRSRNLTHALAQRGLWIARRWPSLRRTVLLGQIAGSALTVAVGRHHIIYNLFHERWPGNFFDRTSWRTALSRLSSTPGPDVIPDPHMCCAGNRTAISYPLHSICNRSSRRCRVGGLERFSTDLNRGGFSLGVICDSEFMLVKEVSMDGTPTLDGFTFAGSCGG